MCMEDARSPIHLLHAVDAGSHDESDSPHTAATSDPGNAAMSQLSLHAVPVLLSKQRCGLLLLLSLSGQYFDST